MPGNKTEQEQPKSISFISIRKIFSPQFFRDGPKIMRPGVQKGIPELVKNKKASSSGLTRDNDAFKKWRLPTLPLAQYHRRYEA
jgi:hypothetical protein